MTITHLLTYMILYYNQMKTSEWRKKE